MSLELIIGSMYSGKSTELLRRVKRVQSIGMRCLVINHTSDTRVDGNFVQTHDGNMLRAVKTDDLLLGLSITVSVSSLRRLFCCFVLLCFFFALVDTDSAGSWMKK